MPNTVFQSRRAANSPVSLSEQAYEKLMEQLLSNKLSPGMLVNRRELALDLNMSVAPVLEAIVQLEAEGFLQSVPRKGTLVRGVDFKLFRGQLLMREALECEAARYYCGEPITKAAHLKKLAMDADAGEQKSFVELWKAESGFHLAVMELTNCEVLVEAYKKVMQRKLFASVNLMLGGEAFTGGNHVTLIRELRNPDPDRAERLMRAHLRFNKDRLFSAPFI